MSFELTPEDFKRAKLTIGLIVINIIAFIVVNMIMGNETLFKVGQINYFITNNGEWYRVFTSIFFHANAQHLLSNMIALLFIGSYSELSYPKKYLYLINYILSGLVGSLFTFWINDAFTFSLGASGAIAGLYGAHLVLMDRSSQRFQIYSLIFIISFLISSFAPGIGTWAHIFGLLSGALFGYIIKRKYKQKLLYRY